MPELVEETLRNTADDFEWTMSAVKAIGAVVDQELPAAKEMVEPQEIDTDAQRESSGEDEPECSEEVNSSSEEEDSASSASRGDGSRHPCVVVEIEGREAVLMLKAVADGFVSVKFFDEPAPIEIEVDRVRLLRVDDGRE